MKSIFLTLALVTSLNTWAGPRIVGNGGIAVHTSDRLVMLDLFERGITQGYYNPNTKILPWLEAELERIIGYSNLTDFPLSQLVRKLSEIYQVDKVLGMAILNSISRLDWRLVEADLTPTEDARTPLDGLRLKQVAVRTFNAVYISKALWEQMDADNKLALVIHEAVYYFAPVSRVGDTSSFLPDAPASRNLTGYLFTPRFSAEGLSEELAHFPLHNIVNAYSQIAPNYSFMTSPTSLLWDLSVRLAVPCNVTNCKPIEDHLERMTPSQPYEHLAFPRTEFSLNLPLETQISMVAQRACLETQQGNNTLLAKKILRAIPRLSVRIYQRDTKMTAGTAFEYHQPTGDRQRAIANEFVPNEPTITLLNDFTALNMATFRSTCEASVKSALQQQISKIKRY